MKTKPLIFSVNFDTLNPPSKLRARLGKYATFTPAETTAAMKQIRSRAILAGAQELRGPVSIAVIAVFSVPDSYSKIKRADCLAGRIRPTVTPDFDNITKLVCDSLGFKRKNKRHAQIPGVAYHDDCQIVREIFEKWYGEQTMIIIAIKPTDLCAPDFQAIFDYL